MRRTWNQWILLAVWATSAVTLGCARHETVSTTSHTESATPAAADRAPGVSPERLEELRRLNAEPANPNLRKAAGELADAHSYHFVFTREIAAGKTDHYEGDTTLGNPTSWRYTLSTTDPDRKSFAGDWIVISASGGYDVTGYHKDAGGTWSRHSNKDKDLRNMPDPVILAEDSFRRTMTTAALVVNMDDPSLQPKLAGNQTVEGKDCDHYIVEARSPLLPGLYDIDVDRKGIQIVRFQATSRNEKYAEIISSINVPVTIEAPK